MSDEASGGTVGIMTRVTPELRNRLKAEALRRGITLQALVVEAVQTELVRAVADRAE